MSNTKDNDAGTAEGDGGAGREPRTDVVETAAEEVMRDESPEGRPPQHEAQRRSQVPLIGVLLLLLAAIVASFVLLDPAIATIATLIVLLVYVISAAPVWGAAMLRRKEKKSAETRVRREMAGKEG